MKGPAVPSGEQHQRKEARRKEQIMPTRRKREDHSWEVPRVWRAAIYLCEFGTDEPDLLRNVPSIDQQRALCRCVATVLHAEVIGEFVDKQRFWWPSRQGLHKVVELAGQGQRLDYLIVSSRDRLAGDCDEAFEVAWRLGLAGTVVVPADTEHEIPWTGATPPSRD
jgi:Resolvase, N terminal domain